MKKRVILINGINSELAKEYLKVKIKKVDFIGIYKNNYNGLKHKNLRIFNQDHFKKKGFKILKNYREIIFINFAAKRDEKLIVNSKDNILKTIEDNIVSSINIIKIALKFMIENKYGRIIFISSSTAESGAVGNVGYSISKSSLVGLSNTVAKEYSNFNVTSNILSLGYFKTKMWSSLKDNTQKQLLKNTLHQALGNPKVLIDTIDLIIKHPFINMGKFYIDGGNLSR
jgi:NAD(P)-dependent dehydrogenase (short-subunit alcohol dehydrogenase family)